LIARRAKCELVFHGTESIFTWIKMFEKILTCAAVGRGADLCSHDPVAARAKTGDSLVRHDESSCLLFEHGVIGADLVW